VGETFDLRNRVLDTRIGWILHCRNRDRREQALLDSWEKSGRHGPPPGLYKRKTLLDTAKAYGIDVLVESGTYLGDTVSEVKGEMKEVHSIELDEVLHSHARKRFSRDTNVHLIQGDSQALLPSLTGSIKGPALFWLDGHYSGTGTAKGSKVTPILSELETIGRRS